MRFPLGTNLCDHLWAHSWGEAWPRLLAPSNRVVATGVPMSAVPGVSQFWSAVNDESATLTWQDFFLGRDTDAPVSAQLELFPSGDFFGPHQEMPEGANEDAYCWVDIMVSNADALVTFAGDGPSALPDPRFMAKAGEVHRVTILIGKTYAVTCPMPVEVVDKSDYDIDVCQDSETKLVLCWPVEIYADEARTCGGTCTCTGCGALGCYVYERYRLPADGGPCGCGGEPPGGHVRFEMIGEDKLERVSGNCTFPFESDVGAGKWLRPNANNY